MQQINDQCSHNLTTVKGQGLVACAVCETAEFWTNTGRTDPLTGLGAVFGNFNELDTIPVVGSVSTDVKIYQPADRDDRAALKALPKGVWLRAQAAIWISSDGDHLLISANPNYVEDPAEHSGPTLTLVQ